MNVIDDNDGKNCLQYILNWRFSLIEIEILKEKKIIYLLSPSNSKRISLTSRSNR